MAELTEKELQMYYTQKKHIKVTCTRGQVIQGVCDFYTQPLDNEPEISEITIKTSHGLVDITEPEIVQIEDIDTGKIMWSEEVVCNG